MANCRGVAKGAKALPDGKAMVATRGNAGAVSWLEAREGASNVTATARSNGKATTRLLVLLVLVASVM